jgi:hypothetical protein
MSDHHLIQFALESVDAIMSPPKQPKVLLFDIGGVCVSKSLSFTPLFLLLAPEGVPFNMYFKWHMVMV